MSLSMRCRVVFIAAVLCLAGGVLCLRAQQPGGARPATPDDVVRISTELIQSPVIVLDKQGNFVTGLMREQFELSIDGQPRPISFFEPITAGAADEGEKYRAARDGKPAVAPRRLASVPGRTVVFFVDDFHLNDESVSRTRAALLHYVDNSLGQNDRALVVAASSQIGFLSQLTDNKAVLRAAIERLKSRDFVVADEARPPMNAYQAFSIEAGDSGTIRYFADMAVQDSFGRQQKQPNLGRSSPVAGKDWKAEQVRNQAEAAVKNRARGVLTKYSTISGYTLSSLKEAVVSLSQVPGGKLAFFISDGFFLSQQVSREAQELNEITSSAMKAGTVIYSIQASGLGTSFPEAKVEVRLSPRGEPGRPMIGQDTAIQAPLYSVAVDTGGRALFNSNSMDGSIQQGLAETSRYYLLAWRPEEEKRVELFHRVQVRIKDHPEFTVRMQKGYFASVAAKPAAAAPAAKPTTIPETSEAQRRAEKMREALSALYPLRELPTIINLSFADQPGTGAILNIGTELGVGLLPHPSETGKQAMLVHLGGVVLNDQGKTVSSFSGQLNFDLDSSGATERQTVSHVDEVKITPGIYQVRVAARDEKSGITGSAAEWIVIPDLTKGSVALSSLLMGDAADAGAPADQKARVSINHHFTRAGRLRFITYIYNASRGIDGKTAPDVTVQLRVRRDDQVLSTSPPIKIPTEGIGDLARIPYAADIALRKLPPGRYSLTVTASDNLTKSNFTQSGKFVVE